MSRPGQRRQGQRGRRHFLGTSASAYDSGCSPGSLICPSTPSRERAIPFLVLILAEGGEGGGREFKTGRKRLFVWLALVLAGRTVAAPGAHGGQRGKARPSLGRPAPHTPVPSGRGPQETGSPGRGKGRTPQGGSRASFQNHCGRLAPGVPRLAPGCPEPERGLRVPGYSRAPPLCGAFLTTAQARGRASLSAPPCCRWGN